MAEKLYHQDAAEHVGLKVSMWRDYASSRAGKPPRAPKPDGVDVEHGHARPYWYASTLDAWKASRPGPGVGGGRPRRAAS